jgi:hypothetical protein
LINRRSEVLLQICTTPGHYLELPFLITSLLIVGRARWPRDGILNLWTLGADVIYDDEVILGCESVNG